MSTGGSREPPVDNACFSGIVPFSWLRLRCRGLGIWADEGKSWISTLRSLGLGPYAEAVDGNSRIGLMVLLDDDVRRDPLKELMLHHDAELA